jgi:hypothetical protein
LSIIWCFKINKSNKNLTVNKTLHVGDRLCPWLQAKIIRATQPGPICKDTLNLWANDIT